ncbi:MAG TPA: carboxypeptidase regulatory-like domain-containing protein [Acidobacteriaceae bacterium]|nr:carboxypeptidase regulatory-like domain-containing protein [Acidobacteriaceae bacterium]
MNRISWKKIIAPASACLLAALLLVPASLHAQQAAGSITGTVTDQSGAAIPGAAVTARDVSQGTTWTTRTDSAGVYEFPRVSVGQISLRVQAPGFATQQRADFSLVVNQVARIDFRLAVGQVNNTVIVSGAAPLLQTDSSIDSTVLNSQAATSLPLASRDINQLTLLVPGVVSTNIYAFEAPQNTFGTGRPFVNGAREQDDNFSLDGMDMNQPDNAEVAYVPSPDAIQNMEIITSNAPADFGNYLGGIIVETLKSGTSQFHGDIFEFLRNTDLDANSWQNKAQQFASVDPALIPRTPLQWNEFGATLGGPILRNKLFFFADYQGSRYNTPATSTPFSAIPAAFRTGDFSSLCPQGFTSGICNNKANQLYDPASSSIPADRTPFLNNQVPIRSSVAQKLISSSLFPPATAGNYLSHNYVNSDQGDLKIDWQPTQNDHIMGRYSQQYVINNTVNSLVLIPSLTREYPLKNFVFDYARTISPTLVNEVRVGAQIFPANDQVYTNPTGQDLPTLFGIPGVDDTILPDINFNGVYSDIGNADLVEIFHDTTLEGEDLLTWTHGKHVVTGGFEYFHYIMNDLYPGNQGLAGGFTFTGQFTGNSASGTTGGNPVADFLLGLPEEVLEGTPLTINLRNSLFGGFAQDNWKVNRNLTLNLGLRYELTTARGDKVPMDNVNFSLITGTPEIGTNYNTYTGIDNFQPRIGFAWQPSFDRRSVIRGAYDISTFMEANGLGNAPIANPPYQVARDEINQGLAEPLTTLDQGYSSFPAATCTPAALMAFSPDCLSSATVHLTNPNLQPAVDQQWNLAIQHQLGTNAVASLGYVGNKVDHMTDIFLYNQKVLGPNGAVAPPPYAAPLVNAGADVRYNDSSGIQRYNAMELTVADRAFHGLDLQAAWTWSKCLTNSFGYFGQYGDEEGIGQSQTNGGGFFFQNEYNPMADYGRCFSDIAQDVNGYAVYNLPFGKGQQFGGGVSPVVNQVIGGWQVAPDFTFHSGFALNLAAPDESGTGSFQPRPDCVAGAPNNGSGQFESFGSSVGIQYLNPGAVSLPATGTFGNCQVGAMRGPGLKTADVNLTKTFPIRERLNLQFMAQFLNVTNTPIFGVTSYSCGPECNGQIQTGATGGNTGAGTFGVAESQDPGRQVQFSLKVNY